MTPGLTLQELQQALEAECRVSAELRAELQKAKEEIHSLRETLRLYQPLSGSTAAESPVHGATQLSDEVTANSWAESEKADRLTQSGSLEAESADTAAKGSYVKAEGKVYWVSYEDPEQLIRLPARNSSEKSARLSASEARPEEPSRRLSGHEKFLPGTPEDHLPRPMRPASLDPQRPRTAYFAGAGTGGRAPIYVQPVMPMSARRTLPPQHLQRPMVSSVHGLPRQASSGHFPPATLRHQFSTGSLSSVQSSHRLVQANSLADLHGHSGHVQTQFAGRFQPVQPAQFVSSRTPRKEGSAQPLYYVQAPQPAPAPAAAPPPPPAPPARPQKAAGIAAGIAPASARPPKSMRSHQDELMNLQSHLKRLQGLQAQLEQQLSDVQ